MQTQILRLLFSVSGRKDLKKSIESGKLTIRMAAAKRVTDALTAVETGCACKSAAIPKISCEFVNGYAVSPCL